MNHITHTVNKTKFGSNNIISTFFSKLSRALQGTTCVKKSFKNSGICKHSEQAINYYLEQKLST